MIRQLVVAFLIVAACLVIHVIGMVRLSLWLFGKRDLLEQRSGLIHDSSVLIAVFGIIVPLHMIEAAIWAAFYWLRNLFPDFETSLYFSLTCYTTIGHGDVVLPQHWRLLGGIEGITGVLLCGLSTAFIFAIVNALLQNHIKRHFKVSETDIAE